MTAEPSRRPRRAKATQYTAADIQVLEGLQAVRKRPGMYIGSTDARGLHQLVWEVVDNSIDEAMANAATRLDVTIHSDGQIEVVDDGRGIPVDKHVTGKSALEVIMTVLHAGGKFGGGGYKVSGGLHGVGVSVVNALASEMRVEVLRDGKRWTQSYQRGDPTSAVRQDGGAKEANRGLDPAWHRTSGTRTFFRPDPQIFETLDFSWETIATRLRESAYLNKGLWIRLIDERIDREKNFFFQGGVTSFVRHLNRRREVLNSRPIHVERVVEGTSVEVALQYNDGFAENVLPFANNIHTVDGGTHVTGFRAALTSSLNDWARKSGTLSERDTNLSGDDVREGLTAVISVKLTDPQFEGQTKAKLGKRRRQGHRPDRGRRRDRAAPRGEPRRRTPHHREVAHGCPGPRGGAQGARPRHPQGGAGWHGPAGEAGRLPGARPRAQRAVHRRGRLRRRLGEAGPRPAFPGRPPAAREAAERRKGAARPGALERERATPDHRARAPASATSSTSPSSAITASAS